jgi:cell division septation protein DedD
MKIRSIIIPIVLGLSATFAQAPNSNWEKLIELDDHYVFIDTTNIRLIEKQISVPSLSIYKNPKFIDEIKKEATSVKNQLLFDYQSYKYTVVGTLYYDKLWRIIGESYTPGRSINTNLFALAIDSDKIMNTVYNRCVDFINKKNAGAETIDVSKTNSKSGAKTQENTPIIIKKNSEDSTKPIREFLTEKFIDKKLNEESVPTVSETIPPPPSTQTPQTPKETRKTEEYNHSNEKNIKGTIFTDGNKYCFQVSSWKIRSQAEKAVIRLSNFGHNAFITEAYLPNKGGNWYRVRIGYFNTMEEAERYKRTMR